MASIQLRSGDLGVLTENRGNAYGGSVNLAMKCERRIEEMIGISNGKQSDGLTCLFFVFIRMRVQGIIRGEKKRKMNCYEISKLF